MARCAAPSVVHHRDPCGEDHTSTPGAGLASYPANVAAFHRRSDLEGPYRDGSAPLPPDVVLVLARPSSPPASGAARRAPRPSAAVQILAREVLRAPAFEPMPPQASVPRRWRRRSGDASGLLRVRHFVQHDGETRTCALRYVNRRERSCSCVTGSELRSALGGRGSTQRVSVLGSYCYATPEQNWAPVLSRWLWRRRRGRGLPSGR